MLEEFKGFFRLEVATLSWVLSWVFIPLISGAFCNPVLMGEKGYWEYYYNASSYCRFYDDIFHSYFSFGNNNFIDLFLYTLLGYFAALVIEIIFTIYLYVRFKLIKNPNIAAKETEDREAALALHNPLNFQVRIIAFILFFLVTWTIGGV